MFLIAQLDKTVVVSLIIWLEAVILGLQLTSTRMHEG